MAALTGKFVHLDTDTLNSMRTDWNACLKSIAVGHQSYSMAGRTFTRANLEEVSDMVAEIAYALKLNSGNIQRTTYSDMS